MKPSTEMHEGPDAFTRFRNAVKRAIGVPREEMQRRLDEQRKASADKPKRGPKPKTQSGI